MTYDVQQTEAFAEWHRGLRDLKARVAIARRIDRAAHGNFGDHKSVSEGVSELWVDVGAGYRVYYTIRNNQLVILLCGGDKKTQSSDVTKAKRLAREF